MATNKHKKKAPPPKRTFKFDVIDERVPKIMGIFCWFIAFYLFIAFTSYLFTWQEDQDRVLRFSWSLFTQSDLQMANWLGRLGAIISNMFFYWGFGIPSFIFIFLMYNAGKALIKNIPLTRFYSTFKYSLVILLLLSVLFEFVNKFHYSIFVQFANFYKKRNNNKKQINMQKRSTHKEMELM